MTVFDSERLYSPICQRKDPRLILRLTCYRTISPHRRMPRLHILIASERASFELDD